jgi:hypothetical protein
MWLFRKDPQKFVSKHFDSILRKAVEHLKNSPLHVFDPMPNIDGNGVYAIYYLGNESIYCDIRICYPEVLNNPIYVGKAVPRGWRSSRQEGGNSNNLQKRLEEHYRSLEQAQNLWQPNFRFKYITLSADLITAVEAEAIRTFKPLWNSVIEGFGNHNVGRTRLSQQRSAWDTIHPGRPWADNMDGPTSYDVEGDIYERLERLGD